MCSGLATTQKVLRSQLQVYDNTATAVIGVGTSTRVDATLDATVVNEVSFVFTIGVTSDLILRHFLQASVTNIGLGGTSLSGVYEVYADIKFWKVV